MKLKLYTVINPVEYFDIKYDSYCGFVIAAFSKSDAKLIAIKGVVENGEDDDWSNAPVERIGTYKGAKTEQHIILSSYKAG